MWGKEERQLWGLEIQEGKKWKRHQPDTIIAINQLIKLITTLRGYDLLLHAATASIKCMHMIPRDQHTNIAAIR
jgi:hypothetical protein